MILLFVVAAHRDCEQGVELFAELTILWITRAKDQTQPMPDSVPPKSVSCSEIASSVTQRTR